MAYPPQRIISRVRPLEDNSKNPNGPLFQDLIKHAQVANPQVPLRVHQVSQSLPQALAVSILDLGLIRQVCDRFADAPSPERGERFQVGSGLFRPFDLVHAPFSNGPRAGCAGGAILRAPSTMEIGPLRERLSKLQSRLEILRGHL